MQKLCFKEVFFQRIFFAPFHWQLLKLIRYKVYTLPSDFSSISSHGYNSRLKCSNNGELVIFYKSSFVMFFMSGVKINFSCQNLLFQTR